MCYECLDRGTMEEMGRKHVGNLLFLNCVFLIKK